MFQQQRLKLAQFCIPDATWKKLQESQCIIGSPDQRKDCVINVFAFIGVIPREDAEKIAKSVNERQFGISPTDAAAYLEDKGGYEKNPHGIRNSRTIDNVMDTYKEVKENFASVIGICRQDGTGHAASVICIGGNLMVFDPQSEVLTHNIRDWLVNENAVEVGTILKVNKRVHRREETSVSIRKLSHNKCRKIEKIEKEPSWKTKNLANRRERAKLNARREFVEIMTSLGFDNLLD